MPIKHPHIPEEQRAEQAEGLNPDKKAFHELDSGTFRIARSTARIEGAAGRAAARVYRSLFGKPLATAQESQERLSTAKALPILASDNISSSAYATEEIMRVLALGGAAALTLAMPVSLALITVVAIVVISYTQIIRAYPQGGGSYNASRENLGDLPGLIAAASLLVDYVLTVAVSISAGVAALTSLMPTLYDLRVPIALLVIAVLVVGNLRGIRETGKLFSAPTYVYLVIIFGLIIYGIFRYQTGRLPEYTPPVDWLPAAASPLAFLLLVRAFSSGAVALTGVEAVSNGMKILQPPEQRNAKTTLILMAVLFGTIFIGIGYLSSHIGLIPDPHERETLLSQLARHITGEGLYYDLVQISTALLLLLAANTAFVGFPRMGMVLAADRFMPNQFAFRGRRLAPATGIVALGTLAAILIIIYGGSVTSLIPLYTVGVFLAFTLAQAGMIFYWRRHRERGWRVAMILNGFGAFVTGLVAIEVIVTKFTHGAWMVMVLIPVLVVIMKLVYHHYKQLGNQLRLDLGMPHRQYTSPRVAVVPIADLNQAVTGALAFARSLSTDVRAIHVADDLVKASKLRERWDEQVLDVPLLIIESPYRDWTGPLRQYVQALSRQDHDAPVAVVIPEFVPMRWWEHLLHSQSGLRLKMNLFTVENVVVIDIPYHVKTTLFGGPRH
ncbi:MAG: APC family permease [SAR202 cluster bacterium]|nr:APC family permease [SAR202 cluster bacterium]